MCVLHLLHSAECHPAQAVPPLLLLLLDPLEQAYDEPRHRGKFRFNFLTGRLDQHIRELSKEKLLGHRQNVRYLLVVLLLHCRL